MALPPFLRRLLPQSACAAVTGAAAGPCGTPLELERHFAGNITLLRSRMDKTLLPGTHTGPPMAPRTTTEPVLPPASIAAKALGAV